MYLIKGTIDTMDQSKTIEARTKARDGGYDPPEGIKFICEYEEPDGSYFELVDADNIENLVMYMNGSRYLFREYTYNVIDNVEFNKIDTDNAFKIEYRQMNTDTLELLGAIVLKIKYDNTRYLMILNEQNQDDLFIDVSNMLRYCDQIKISPIMDVERVWRLTT